MKNNKIAYLIVGCLTIISIIIIATMGLNFSLRYSPSKQIKLNIGTQFDSNDIMSIVKEVIGNKDVIVQKVEVYEDAVSIIASQLSEDEIKEINNKINEKYGIENTMDDIVISEQANVRGRDLIKPYILPIAISLAVILVYAGIRYRKIQVLEVIGKIIGFNVFAALVYVAVLSIARLPVNQLSIPVGLAIYTIITIVVFNDFETREEKLREQEKKKRK